MPLRIVECEYPNGNMYGVFFLGIHEIGRAYKNDAGWVTFCKRKPVTAEMAAKAMIETMVRKAMADLAHAEKMMVALRLYCGGKLPKEEK